MSMSLLAYLDEFNNGFAAYENGEPYDPPFEGQRKDAWIDGWNEARKNYDG